MDRYWSIEDVESRGWAIFVVVSASLVDDGMEIFRIKLHAASLRASSQHIDARTGLVHVSGCTLVLLKGQRSAHCILWG